MNPLELSRALTGVDEKLVEDAAPEGRVYDRERITRPMRIWRIAAPVALLVALAILLHSVLPKNTPVPGPVNKAYALEIAEYPEAPNLVEYFSKQDALWEELGQGKISYEELNTQMSALDVQYAQALSEAQTYERRIRAMQGAGKGLEAFFTGSAAAVLTGAGSENRVYSPLNTCLALAMLAEITGGESREQILSLLGADSIDDLRTRANHIWNANYRDDGFSRCIPAGSLWLGEDIPLNADTLKTLATNYYSSSFQGEMGSKDYLDCMKGWLSEATGGLLDEQAGDLTMEPNDVLILLSTLWYEAGWQEEFFDRNNIPGVFHSPDGDTQAEYMYQSIGGYYLWGERFSAIYKALTDGSRMWFILPDEGVGVDDLLADEEYRQFVETALREDGYWEKRRDVTINLRLPKFDVSSSMDLIDTLRDMGVTDCFDREKSDFTPLSADVNIWARTVQHGARLIVDEKGVRAASFVEIAAAAESAPPDDEVDFTLDRPFVFLLVSNDNIPLYTGVVNQPQ